MKSTLLVSVINQDLGMIISVNYRIRKPRPGALPKPMNVAGAAHMASENLMLLLLTIILLDNCFQGVILIYNSRFFLFCGWSGRR